MIPFLRSLAGRTVSPGAAADDALNAEAGRAAGAAQTIPEVMIAVSTKERSEDIVGEAKHRWPGQTTDCKSVYILGTREEDRCTDKGP